MSGTQLSSWASSVAPSPTLAVDAKAKALKAAGEDVCGFGAGEPDFPTPEFIREACKNALDAGKTTYAPAAGIPPLREALAQKYTDITGSEVAASSVVVSPGGKFSCHLAVMSVCSPGDEVIIPAPYWVSYPEMVKLAGARPVYIEAGYESGFKITPEALAAAITPKSRLFILNSPSNPTGAIYSKEEMQALLDVALDNGLYVMSDEIYEHLLYGGAKHHSPLALAGDRKERIITVSGFSKTYSMTGWRLGTLVADPAIAKAVSSMQSHMTSNATTFAQHGALAVFQHAEKAASALAEMQASFDARRKKLHAGLEAIDGIDVHLAEGAFYLFPRIASFGKTSTDFASQLLDQEQVAVVPGIAFGAEGYMRLSYAASDAVIDKGLERLARFCNSL